MLAIDDWKEDIIPELVDGHNIADCVDPDILERLNELEREEEAAAGEIDDEMDEEEELGPEAMQTLAAIRAKKKKMIEEHRRKKSTAESRPLVPRKHDKDQEFTLQRMGRHLSNLGMDRHLSNLGMDASAAVERARSRNDNHG